MALVIDKRVGRGMDSDQTKHYITHPVDIGRIFYDESDAEREGKNGQRHDDGAEHVGIEKS